MRSFENLRGSVASGGRCQWVLDATCQVVEWLGQPLRFNSVVLRTASRPTNPVAIIELDRWRTNWQQAKPRLTSGAFACPQTARLDALHIGNSAPSSIPKKTPVLRRRLQGWPLVKKSLLESQDRTERNSEIVASAAIEIDFIAHFEAKAQRSDRRADASGRVQRCVHVGGSQAQDYARQIALGRGRLLGAGNWGSAVGKGELHLSG